jgi:hypothetical protein
MAGTMLKNLAASVLESIDPNVMYQIEKNSTSNGRNQSPM